MSLENRLYPPLVGTLTVLFLSCATALAILMLVKVIGPFRFIALSPDEAALSFGLWIPNPGGVETQNRIRAWREIAPRDRALVESESLSELRDQRVRSIAVPDARGLGSRELDELRNYLAAGGGVVLTGSIGVSNPDGSWRGYEQMEALLHVGEIQQLERTASVSVAAARRGPLSSSLAPRERIPLIRELGMPAVDGTSAELRWDMALGPDGRRGLGASRRIDVGGGRIAWLATGPENASEGASEAWHPMLQVLRSAIAWSAKLPSIEVLPWPGGAAFAAKYDAAGGRDAAESRALSGAAEVLLEIESALDTGGLVHLALEETTQSGGKQNPTSLKSYAEVELRKRAAWIAREREIMRWSTTYSSFRASFRQRGPRRVQVDVTNGARVAAEDVVVRLHVNRPVISVSSASTQVLQKPASLRFEERAEWIDVIVPSLEPRSSHSYYVDFELLSDLSGNFQDPVRPAIDGRKSPVHIQL